MINKNLFVLNLEERVLNEVVFECVEMLQDKAGYKKIQIVFEEAQP
jgi:hypothetical protein